ncbi:MAG: preprotein translocase subunit YajC [Planctomycetes bacterium]|nr:preprotein translocase subunit YajC [Planctomycetota bacterium]
MNDLIPSLILFAEEEATAGGAGMVQMLTMFLPLILLWVLLIEGPRRKQARQRDELLKNLKKNDRVVTSGGIFGVVTNVQTDSNEVTIRVDEATNTKIRVLLSSIDRVLAETEEASSETKESK